MAIIKTNSCWYFHWLNEEPRWAMYRLVYNCNPSSVGIIQAPSTYKEIQIDSHSPQTCNRKNMPIWSHLVVFPCWLYPPVSWIWTAQCFIWPKCSTATYAFCVPVLEDARWDPSAASAAESHDPQHWASQHQLHPAHVLERPTMVACNSFCSSLQLSI